MELNYYIDKYGHKKVKCPFCLRECFVRELTKTTPNVLVNLMRHITVEAKTEALESFIEGGQSVYGNYQHLTYYRDHTNPQNEIRKPNRKFDDSLFIKSLI